MVRALSLKGGEYEFESHIRDNYCVGTLSKFFAHTTASAPPRRVSVSASDWYALREALYKCIGAIHYMHVCTMLYRSDVYDQVR